MNPCLIVAGVNLRKLLRWLAFVPAVVLLGTGCSGINASHSISPATFLLPGLMKATPPSEILPSEPQELQS
jgi:hypothetical protein